jgi:FixJ family two-component response regulator
MKPCAESIGSLVRSAGYEGAIFESAESFLVSDRVHDMDCIVIDFHMPGLDGLELQCLLPRRCLSSAGTTWVGFGFFAAEP